MQENGFWDDISRAEEVTKESKRVKDKLDRYNNVVSKFILGKIMITDMTQGSPLKHILLFSVPLLRHPYCK